MESVRSPSAASGVSCRHDRIVEDGLMFKNTEDFFSKDSPLQFDHSGTATPRDMQLAVLVLLLDLADSDSVRSSNEVNAIVRSMNQAFGLRDENVGDLLEIAQIIDSSNKKREEFVSALNAQLSLEQRCYLMSLIWKVALADGLVDTREAEFATHARTLLGLSLEAAVSARKQAEE